MRNKYIFRSSVQDTLGQILQCIAYPFCCGESLGILKVKIMKQSKFIQKNKYLKVSALEIEKEE